MANICETRFYIQSANKEALDEFQQVIKTYNGGDFKRALAKYGVAARGLDCYLHFMSIQRRALDKLEFTVYSDWAAPTEAMDALISVPRFSQFNVIYVAVEVGSELYESNWEEAPGYYVEYSLLDEEGHRKCNFFNFNSEAEALHLAGSLADRVFHSLDEVNEYVEECRSRRPEEDSFFTLIPLTVNEYTFGNRENEYYPQN
jgi:hypothetical protein